jgi:RNA-directed DNA polymerase
MSADLPPRTRQELYERIARSGKDEVTLEEMIRLGFWSADKPIAADGTTTQRVVELRRRLDELRVEASKLANLKQLAEDAKKQRMAESRKRRLETKQKRLAEREARKAVVREKKTREITYLGERVSAGLGPTEDRLVSDAGALEKHGLPKLESAPALAGAMGLTISELRFLSFQRDVSTVSHYRRFKIPKRTGGERVISAPQKRLKAAQHWILHNLLEKLPVSGEAHGFCRERSIVSNAKPHVGASVLINVDLKDFFPSVSYRRVKGLFRKLGYCEEVATILALLCTEPDTVQAELDGMTYYVAQSERRLPQGAPTSPALTNALCRRLDKRLAGFARKHQLNYTRYADDLTLSAPAGVTAHVGAMLAVLNKVAKQEGFTLHPEKVSVKRRAQRQEVTGIVVNERLAIDRRTLRRFRALLFQIEKDGPEGKRWGNGENVVESAIGFANYVAMVDPAKGKELKTRALALRKR